MGTLPNRNSDASCTLSGMLGVFWEEGTDTGYGPFVPDILRPNTYGFGVLDGIWLRLAPGNGWSTGMTIF
jgi:hypothetical protein